MGVSFFLPATRLALAENKITANPIKKPATMAYDNGESM
jgi:hypothetical protein